MNYTLSQIVPKVKHFKRVFASRQFKAADQIPSAGVIGYATNNAAKAYSFLRGPCDKLGFQMKDFSTLDQMDQKLRLDLVAQKLNSYTLTDNPHISLQEGKIGEPLDASGVVLVKNFPKDLAEAKVIEQATVGLNLFIDFKFEGSKKPDEKKQLFSTCPKCGAFGDNDDEVLSHSCGVNPCPEAQPKYAELKDTKVSQDVVDFYKARNAYLEFVVKEGESKEDSQVRFVRELLHHFRY